MDGCNSKLTPVKKSESPTHHFFPSHCMLGLYLSPSSMIFFPSDDFLSILKYIFYKSLFVTDEFNMVDRIVNKFNALWSRPQLAVLYHVVPEMYCASNVL